VRDGDPVALRRERLRDRQADATVTSGHQHGAGHAYSFVEGNRPLED
jgi:hypothetical protein